MLIKHTALCLALLTPVAIALAQTAYHYPAATGQVTCAGHMILTISGGEPNHHYTITAGKTNYSMVRVPTESGVIRLEDKARGIVWLQMANKSMLFDEKNGKRLATDCRNEHQALVQKALDQAADFAKKP